MNNKFTTKEMGEWKIKIGNALMHSDDLMGLLTGKNVSTFTKVQRATEFKKYVSSHLFINDDALGSVLDFKDSRIFFDISIVSTHPQTKTCSIMIVALCHRDILDTYDGNEYLGNRADVMAQMIEEALLDEKIVKNFGIGDLSLDSVEPYNSTTMYGRILMFSVPNFR